ncbi:DUF4340 domain-containing protein [Candidatus Parabeggiatoa sp. HSG14]|uniref:DUF4340 domain-containing protein n=1 Tax=Candidatus Parabeggiatoa sp. HSG14 TaxID=3055593 RepID=UPI0025A765BD|nr:DUF4340 domain-containing protein [Thiotrichales bacterium HSG14]
MHQRWLLNIILLGIILILGGVVFYTLEKEKPIESPKLTEINADRVQKIRIERAGKTPVSLKKDVNGFWQITEPLTLPANSVRADRFLRILSERQYKQLESSELNLVDFKLEPPLASIKFDQFTVAFGEQSPMGDGKRYMLINQKVYLLTDTAYNSVTNDAVKFVHLSPLGNTPKIQALKIPNYDLVLKKGEWTLTSTFSDDEIETSTDALNTLIDNWQIAQSYSVEIYEVDGNAENQAEGEIDVTLQGQEKPLHFVIVSTSPDFLLARPDRKVQYRLPMSQVDKLLHLPTQADTNSSEQAEKQTEEQPEEKKEPISLPVPARY